MVRVRVRVRIRVRVRVSLIEEVIVRTALTPPFRGAVLYDYN